MSFDININTNIKNKIFKQFQIILIFLKQFKFRKSNLN